MCRDLQDSESMFGYMLVLNERAKLVLGDGDPADRPTWIATKTIGLLTIKGWTESFKSSGSRIRSDIICLCRRFV